MASAEIEGEKKYSPPRDSTKSVTRVIDLLELVGSRPWTKRGCPAFAPIMGSNPGVGSILLKKNLVMGKRFIHSNAESFRNTDPTLLAQFFWRKWKPSPILDWYATTSIWFSWAITFYDYQSTNRMQAHVQWKLCWN